MSPATDRLAGGSRSTTEQPSAGGVRQAPDPATTSPVCGGGQTLREASSPNHSPRGASTSPEDRGRAVPGTEAGSGAAGGVRDAASRPLPAGSSGAEWRQKVKAATSALHAEQRRRATRYAPKAKRGTGAGYRPGMTRRPPPETPGGEAS